VWREQNFEIALLCNRTTASLTALEAQIANLYLTAPIGGGINAPASRMTLDDFQKMQTPEYAVATQPTRGAADFRTRRTLSSAHQRVSRTPALGLRLTAQSL
jgi:hypothetical protein